MPENERPVYDDATNEMHAMSRGAAGNFLAFEASIPDNESPPVPSPETSVPAPLDGRTHYDGGER